MSNKTVENAEGSGAKETVGGRKALSRRCALGVPAVNAQ